VAVPERILGDGLFERIRTLNGVRKRLLELDNYVYIHLLGTGNPLSLLMFSIAGADSFDGLEWCQTSVDSRTGLLYHFQQRELILDDCEFCNNKELDYTLSTLAHNLRFYRGWMTQIQECILSSSEIELAERYLGHSVVEELKAVWN
jgi:queuine/archaeosine tRNA-ribosyltransferase